MRYPQTARVTRPSESAGTQDADGFVTDTGAVALDVWEGAVDVQDAGLEFPRDSTTGQPAYQADAVVFLEDTAAAALLAPGDVLHITYPPTHHIPDGRTLDASVIRVTPFDGSVFVGWL